MAGHIRRRSLTSHIAKAVFATRIAATPMTFRPTPGAFVAAVNQRFFYGWLVLFAAAIGMFATGPGQSYSFSVFVDPIAADLRIGATEVASAYGLATLFAAFALPFVGRLVDLYGARIVLVCVAILLGFASLGFALVDDVVTLTIGFGVLRFLGQGALMLICANLVSQWFIRRRGLAMSLMMLGFAASMALYPPIGERLIGDLSAPGADPGQWRGAWPWFAGMTWVLLLPLAAIVVRGRPEDVGLRPDGDSLPERAAAAAEQETGAAAITGATLRQALGTPAFYIIAAGLFSMSMLSTGLHFFQVSIFRDQGLDTETAARVFTVIAVAMAVAMPVIGRLLDRFDPRVAFIAALVCQAASLTAAALVDDLGTALVYGVLFGLNNAANMVVATFLWARYFGRRHLGSIMGMAQMLGVVGASLGPLPLGAGHDLFGEYSRILLLLAVIPLLLGVAAVFLKPPRDYA